MKNIELKINKKELDCYTDIKKTIHSLSEVKNNTFRCGKYNIIITDDFIGLDTKYSIDFTTLLKELSEFEPDKNLLECSIDTVLQDKKENEKRMKRYYKMYLKRGYFYSKYTKIKDFLLDNNLILLIKPWDESTYEVLSWNKDYKKNFWKENDVIIKSNK